MWRVKGAGESAGREDLPGWAHGRVGAVTPARVMALSPAEDLRQCEADMTVSSAQSGAGRASAVPRSDRKDLLKQYPLPGL